MTDLERAALAALAAGATVAEVAAEFGIDVDAVRELAGEPPEAAPATRPRARSRKQAVEPSPVEHSRREAARVRERERYAQNALVSHGTGIAATRGTAVNHGYGYASIRGGGGWGNKL